MLVSSFPRSPRLPTIAHKLAKKHRRILIHKNSCMRGTLQRQRVLVAIRILQAKLIEARPERGRFGRPRHLDEFRTRPTPLFGAVVFARTLVELAVAGLVLAVPVFPEIQRLAPVRPGAVAAREEPLFGFVQAFGGIVSGPPDDVALDAFEDPVG